MKVDNEHKSVPCSYFPDEYYCFAGADDKLPVFVEMLRQRGYYIGEDGHFRTPRKGTIASKLLRNGYWMISAQYDKKVYYFVEHRAVWVWYNGAIPKGLQVNHKDYDRGNNRIDNLELLTPKENIAYSKCHNNPPLGERSGKTDLTNKQVQAMKTLVKICGWKTDDVSRLTNVPANRIARYCRGERFPNVIEASDIMEIYPTLVDFTRNTSVPPIEELKDYSLGAAGELGELIDLIKKMLYHGKEVNKVDILNEMGDVFYYLTAICNVLGIDICEVMLNNNAKLLGRYPNGFNQKDAENRIEKC